MSMFRRAPELRWLEVVFDRQLDVEAATALLLSLLTREQRGPVVIEAEGLNASIVFRLGSLHPNVMTNLVRIFLPNAVIRALSPINRQVEGGRAWRLHISDNQRCLSSVEPADVSRRLLSVLAGRNRGKLRVIHQLVIGAHLHPQVIPAEAIQRPSDSWLQAVLDVVLGRGSLTTEARKALQAKRGSHGARVSVRLLVVGSDDNARIAPIVRAYAGALRSLESPGVRIRLKGTNARMAAWGSTRQSVPLNVNEVLRLTVWPFGSESYSGLDRSGSRPLPARGISEVGRVLGVATYPGQSQTMSLSTVDGLRHLRVLGPTGVGKSTLMLNMILQDIASGRGAVVVDPKGELVDAILERVPNTETNCLVVLDPARSDYAVGFNPLAVAAHEADTAVDSILHIIKTLNKESWGPRTQDILHSSLLTLMSTDKPSLPAVPELLRNPSFRRDVLSGQTLSPALRSFWSWYDQMSEAERGNATAPVMNKLRPFLLRSSLESMLKADQSKFDPAAVFSDNMVLLVPLRRAKLGSETANLLGAFVMARVWQLAQAQSALPKSERKPVQFYLDEFQDYLKLPTDLSDILSQSRSLGLGLVLAHQHLSQLSADVASSVEANAQNSVLFRLGEKDAAHFGRHTPELEASDFRGLRAYETYVRLLSGGQLSGLASMRTLLPPRVLRDHKTLARKLAKRWGTRLEGGEATAAVSKPSSETRTYGKRRKDKDDKTEEIGRIQGGETK